ncbi:hypothetical protein ABN763_18870 [Spongiivirga sp. MCCC 1A20706]|uniref:hypothetical protein n=1 Tax=Spongiivirga sp. MCCC 1A20706 TaxID=3160963 RepID=UPI00397750CA
MKAQKAAEIGLKFATKKLTTLAESPKWGDANYEQNYSKFIKKADKYMAILQKANINSPVLAEFKKKIEAYRLAYDQHNTSSKKVIVPDRDTALMEQQHKALAQAQAQQAEMIKQWEKERAAEFDSHKDNGVPNDIHKKHLGKLMFGSYTYGKGNPNFISKVQMETPFDFHLFLPKSIQNLAVDQAKKNNDKRWLAITDNGLEFHIYANGELTHKWVEIDPNNLEPNTYYTGNVMKPEKINFYGSAGFYRYYGQKTIIEKLKAGIHTIKVEVFLFNNTIQDSNKPKVAEGEFELSFSKADWIKLDKERNIKPQRREYRIACLHAVYFRTSPNGIKSEYKGKGSTGSYSKGQKIYVYNPKTGVTTYLKTLSSASDPIIVPKSFCSY